MMLAERLERAAERIDIGPRDLARALDATPRTVSRWLNQETTPRGDAKERMLEVVAVFDRLSATLAPSAAHEWLLAPNPSLDYDKPIDLLREGEFRRVLGAIDALAEGVFV